MESARDILRKNWLILSLIAFLIITSALIFIFEDSFSKSGKTQDSKKPFVLQQGAEYVPDRLVVEFAEGYSPNDKITWKKLEDIGVVAQEKLFSGDEGGLKNFYILTLEKGTDIKKAGEKINAIDEIHTTEADYIAHAISVPNDPNYSRQWHYTKIGMEQAWDKAKGSKSVIAAVLDTGVDYNHPDLPRDIIKGPDFTSADNDPIDRQGHGTHVSGTIGALTNNSAGVAGINWDVRLMIVQVLGDSGSGATSGIVRGIEWAANNGAKVINMSLGGQGSCTSTYQNAVNTAMSKGTIVVVAAGNDHMDAAYFTPASCNGVVTVGATDSSDRRASFSNYGSTVEIAAPGAGIYSTYKGSTYASLSGTSMASPHVAGVVALLLSQKPSLTRDQVVSCLQRNGDPTDANISGKRINMKRMLEDPACSGTTSPSPSLTPTVTPTAGATPPPGSSPTPTITIGPTATVTPRPTATVTPKPTERPRRIVIRFRCFVFEDNNENGRQDAGEDGIEGAEFIVFPKRTYPPTATTSSDGYCYLILIPGEYRVIVKIAGKIAALTAPFAITENQEEQTLSIGISPEHDTPMQPTSAPPGTAYDCIQPTQPGSSKSLQLVNLQCNPR